MFDRISGTYDLLNHLLSLGVDKHWRRHALKALHATAECRVLDCSAGTGDMALELAAMVPGVCNVLLDPARQMLVRADGKAGNIVPSHFVLVQGCAEQLPFPDAHFDRFMVAFGIRNFADLSAGLRELCRVTKPGGKGVILEFTPDRSRAINRLFRFYMLRIMRPVGAWISGDRNAYAYLARTVENFLPTAQLVEAMRDAGFLQVEQRPLSFGISRLFVLSRQ